MSDLKVAYDILFNVYQNGAYASLELSKNIEKASIKNFVTNLVYGVLERDIEFNYYISKLVEKKPKNPIIVVLKIGMYLIKYMESMPTYAAVTKTVDLVKEINKRELTGFVNATLKRFSNQKIPLPQNPIKRISVEYSAPEFLVQEYLNEYGEAKTKAMLTHSSFPCEHFRVNSRTYDIETLKKELKKRGIGYLESMPNALYVKNDKFMHDLFSSGKVTNQSKTSMLTCEKLAPEEGDKILDLCAAPGGKSIYLAEMTTCFIIACDIHLHRLELIKSYMNRMNAHNIEIFQNDATVKNELFVNRFNKVLCDVPCSGLGVAKKKPDIYLNMTRESIKELPEIQYKILDNAKDYIKKDGIIVYSTCTTVKWENGDVVRKFLFNNSDFELISEEQYLQDDLGMDGFYIAKLRRK